MATKKTVKKKVQYLGTGRRKTAIARVRLIPGEGNITINKRTFEDYFPLDTMRLIVNQPLEAVSATDKFDVIVKRQSLPTLRVTYDLVRSSCVGGLFLV